MHRFVCFLRGVNVGGNNLVKMAVLKSLCEALGFERVRTHLQSGNLLVDGRSASRDAVEAKIAGAIRDATGVDVKVVARTPAELRAVLKKNPFPAEAASDPSRLAVVFLSAVPGKKAMEALSAAHSGPERMQLHGAELFVHYSGGMGTSKLTNALIEKKLGVTATTRNWNTATRMLEMAEEEP